MVLYLAAFAAFFFCLGYLVGRDVQAEAHSRLLWEELERLSNET